MKLVTWHEFIEMPEGTVFSDVPRNPFDAIGIRIKGETRRNNWVDDFHESDLMPKIMDVSVSDFEETKGSQIMLIHPAGWGRDGLFDKGRKYWIWEREDCERLARWLLDPAAVAATDELNDDNVRWHGNYDDLEVSA
ncbi:hypothetical protein [Neorhizobium galegae]|uniref:Uncharacterized protein n=1 Tax=Neorhizobium galegae bv. orientalis str. HAMBI 540 TaxID=1028800 RepID=A0A068SM68_NEOGA|nr:hypothetical protein [Neorhizobium galegae]CDN46846.1 Hypothetical protein RG540_CH06560 [Neorhizobium galegae bv. orientalis str. HAMBI 540]